MIKRKWAALFILALFFLSCASLKDYLLNNRPEASIEKVDIKSISLHDINLQFDIGITNPYPMSINLHGVRVKFAVEKAQLFESTTPQGFSVKANGKSVTPFVVNLKYADIEKIVNNYTNRDELNCDITGEIIIQLPKTGIAGVPDKYSFPYKLNTKIPAIKPVISIKNFKVDMPSMDEITASLKRSGKSAVSPDKAYSLLNSIISGKKTTIDDLVPEDLDVKITVSFDFEMQNKTRSKFSFNSINYDFLVAGEPLISGDTKNIRSDGTNYTLSIKNQFSSRALSKSMIKVFRDRQGDFSFKGSTRIKLPDAIKKDTVELKFDEKGRFRL